MDYRLWYACISPTISLSLEMPEFVMSQKTDLDKNNQDEINNHAYGKSLHNRTLSVS